MVKKLVNTKNAPKAIGPYAQAVIIDNMLYTSGQLGLDPESMQFPSGGIAKQAQQMFANLDAILSEAGTNKSNIIKVTCFLSDMNDFSTFNSVYTDYFGNSKHARSCIGVACLPMKALVEIEVIARIT